MQFFKRVLFCYVLKGIWVNLFQMVLRVHYLRVTMPKLNDVCGVNLIMLSNFKSIVFFFVFGLGTTHRAMILNY